MKLRIHPGGVRLRLKQTEVKALVEGGEVADVCPTLPVALRYALRPDAGISDLAVYSAAGQLTVSIPESWLTGWDADERVGFESSSGGIQILIEKDFKCALPASPEDNEDCYENPVACG